MFRTSYLQEAMAPVPPQESSRFSSQTVFAILSHGAPLELNGEVQAAARYARGGLPPRARRRVRDYIAAHLNEKITNAALAEIAGLSICHFARVFKHTEGMSPHQYVLHCRVNRAQELLAGTEMPLSEIAIAAGFSDQSHYTRCFREIIGVTPREYRWSTR
jgi:transcriptional regulator GlxA family with amidase domain